MNKTRMPYVNVMSVSQTICPSIFYHSCHFMDMDEIWSRRFILKFVGQMQFSFWLVYGH